MSNQPLICGCSRKSFVSDERGIVIGMVIMIVSIITVALLWIVTMPAVGLFWESVMPQIPVSYYPIMDMLNNVCGWTLLVLVIGCLAYGAALAFKRDPVEVPY